jgi:hypothetical protein
MSGNQGICTLGSGFGGQLQRVPRKANESISYLMAHIAGRSGVPLADPGARVAVQREPAAKTGAA